VWLASSRCHGYLHEAGLLRTSALSQDYLVLRGLSSWAVGDVSDGLVRIDNATTFGSVNNRVSSWTECFG
jgi:hypothetical protein